MENADNFYYGSNPNGLIDYPYNILNYNSLSNVKLDEEYNGTTNQLANYKADYSNFADAVNYSVDNRYVNDINYKHDDKYITDINYSPDIDYRLDKPYHMDSNVFNKGYNMDNVYEVVNSSDSTVAGGQTNKSNEVNPQTQFVDNNDYQYMKYYQENPYYLNYHNIYQNQPLITNSNPLNNLNNIGHLDQPAHLSSINDVNLQIPSNLIGFDNSFNNESIMKDRDKYSNSTIDNESIEDIDEKDGSKPPANRSDPIYTAISGLKWKSKSKKWVVRWDNPITNRRVYKYFSGSRYGFMGAHKRARYYLEFLNASVGKIQNTTPGNPFCRRTEGPPKGKTNKSLIRKYFGGPQNLYFYQPNANNPNLIYTNNSMNYIPNNVDQYNLNNNAMSSNLLNSNNMNTNVNNTNGIINNSNGINANNLERYNPNVEFNSNGENTGSTMENPWYINQTFNNF